MVPRLGRRGALPRRGTCELKWDGQVTELNSSRCRSLTVKGLIMNCTKTLGLVGLAIVLTAPAGAPVRAGDAPSATFTECAKACADCQLACDACFHHCTELTAGGAKEHTATLQL